jgi:hypothetical protein
MNQKLHNLAPIPILLAFSSIEALESLSVKALEEFP